MTMNLTANAAGGANWLTFYNKLYSFQADANTQVFKAELSGTTITLHEVTAKIVDGGTPVVLKSTASPIVMTLTTTASGNTDDNSLWAVSDPSGETADGNMFVLSNGTKGVGFYKLTSGKTLGVGKAYLYYTGSLAREFFGFDDATGIQELKNGKTEELKSFFDLNGRHVAQPNKGLYIVNGRKVIIK